jgi:putative transcriptional regulator
VRRAAAIALLVLALPAGGQQQSERPNAILLVAKPELRDSNFRQAVVLVTQAEDASTVGVILNRPTEEKDERSGEPIHFGGPVMPGVMVALFRSEAVPEAPAFPVLKGIYLSMHPGILEPLLRGPRGNFRLYSGFSGWAPRQLQGEMARDDWYVLPASEELVFRQDTSGLWRELLERAQARKKPHARRNLDRYTFAHEGMASGPAGLHAAFR